MATISIVIPTFNRAEIIKRTLDSLKTQSFQDWECLIVDDSSTDNSKDIVLEYCKTDNRFKYLINTRQKGAQGARNTGLYAANSDWVFFFDSDNMMHTQLLQSLLDGAEGYDVCKCFSNVVDINTGREVGQQNWVADGNIHQALFDGKTYVDFNQEIIKREKMIEIGGLDENCPSLQEFDTNIRLSRICTYHTVQKALVDYCVGSSDTISANFKKQVKGKYYNLSKYKKEWLENKDNASRLIYELYDKLKNVTSLKFRAEYAIRLSFLMPEMVPYYLNKKLLKSRKEELPICNDNLNYSGPEKLGREFESEVCAQHLFYDTLSHSVVNNGIIIPNGLPFAWGANGGVLDQDFKYVKASAFHEGIAYGEVDNTQFSWDITDDSVGKCIYLGQMCPVWGHVFTDDIKRIWFFDTQQCQRFLDEGYRVVYTTMYNDPLPGYIIDLFNLAGFDIGKCLWISSPTRFKSIIIPDSSVRMKRERGIGVRMFHPMFVDCIRHICQKIDIEYYPDLSFDKVYLTRSRFTGSRKDFNESELESFYSAQGYSIVSPESMPVEQQIYMLRHCNKLVTTDGSIGHSSVFCRPSTNIVILLKADYVNPYQTCISDVFGLDVRYVYAHHSFWVNRNHPSNGPFYLCVTKYMSKQYLPVYLKVSYWKYLVLNCPVLLRIKRVLFHK